MKDKVKQLAEQAGFMLWNNEEWKPEGQVVDWSSDYDKELEKFAQLIVRECIDIVSPYAIRMENFDGGHPIVDLKKHFGVKE